MDRFHTKPIRLDALHSVLSEVSSGQMSKLDSAHYPAALTEMIGLLGADKVRSTADTFFDEVASLCALLRAQDPDTDQAALAEAAHRAKGAASLLGQSALEATLLDMESQARTATLDNPETWAQRLETEMDTSRAQLDAVLQDAVQSA